MKTVHCPHGRRTFKCTITARAQTNHEEFTSSETYIYMLVLTYTLWCSRKLACRFRLGPPDMGTQPHFRRAAGTADPPGGGRKFFDFSSDIFTRLVNVSLEKSSKTRKNEEFYTPSWWIGCSTSCPAEVRKKNANRPRFGTRPTPLTGGSGLSPSADNARHTPGPP